MVESVKTLHLFTLNIECCIKTPHGLYNNLKYFKKEKSREEKFTSIIQNLLKLL